MAPRAERGVANYTIGLRLWYNVRKADIIPDGWPHAEDGGDAKLYHVLRTWYNVRKGQSQVPEETTAKLAWAGASSGIWRAKRTRKTEGFSGLCPRVADGQPRVADEWSLRPLKWSPGSLKCSLTSTDRKRQADSENSEYR